MPPKATINASSLSNETTSASSDRHAIGVDVALFARTSIFRLMR
jgi:hypothetical protein